MNNFFFLAATSRTTIYGTVKTYNEIGHDDFGTTIQEDETATTSCTIVDDCVGTDIDEWYSHTLVEVHDE